MATGSSGSDGHDDCDVDGISRACMPGGGDHRHAMGTIQLATFTRLIPRHCPPIRSFGKTSRTAPLHLSEMTVGGAANQLGKAGS